jgi:hypothetical protein
MRTRFLLLIMGSVVLMSILHTKPNVLLAQSDSDGQTCPAIVETAFDALDTFCGETGRNQVCYGNINLAVEPQPTISELNFSDVGDIINVADVRSMSFSPMNTENGDWGLAMMRLQANIPNTLPGQNVTFILFGDVELTNAVDPETVENGEATPMQAFFLTAGVGDAQCEEAPDSGLLVQTPDGVGEVSFSMNEIDITIGSTILFQGQPDNQLKISALEGSAVLNMREGVFPVIAGTWVRVPFDENLRPTGRPTDLETYKDNFARGLPLNLLERRIEVHQPLTEDQLQMVRDRVQRGEPLCGEEPFPSCDRLAEIAGGRPCVLAPELTGLRRDDAPDREPCEPPDPPACIYPAPLGEGRLRDRLTDIPPCEEPPPLFSQRDAGIRGENLPPRPPDNRDCVFEPGPNDPPLPESETRPFCPTPEPPPPPDDRPCVYPPGPNDPPLPESETRPFCPPPEPGAPGEPPQASPPPDNG